MINKGGLVMLDINSNKFKRNWIKWLGELGWDEIPLVDFKNAIESFVKNEPLNEWDIHYIERGYYKSTKERLKCKEILSKYIDYAETQNRSRSGKCS